MRQITTFLFIGFFLTAPSFAVAKQGRSICGVEIKQSWRCWKELKRLQRACKENPMLLGRLYDKTQPPQLTSLLRRYKQQRRVNRRKWLTSLCDVPLYSPPHSYCGMKGVEVALHCVKQAHPTQTIQPAVGALAQRITRAPVPPSKPRIAPKNTNTPVAGILHTPPPKKQSAQRTAQVTTSNPSGWITFLQLMTFLLLLLVFYRQTGNKRTPNRPWENEERWQNQNLTWEGPAFAENPSTLQLEAIQMTLHENFHDLETKLLQREEKEHHPMEALQQSADSLFAYYCQLATQIAQHSSEHSTSKVHRQLLNAHEKLAWLFRSHREPESSSFVAEFKEIALSHLESLLDASGYTNLEQMIQHLMASGRFTLQDYLKSKTEDQTNLFFEGKPLQNYEDIQSEFLLHLEKLYRSNLDQARDVISTPNNVPKEEQEQLYYQQFCTTFLLEWLPQQLQQITRQSNPSRVGALIDQLLQFSEECLEQSGLELFPVQDAIALDKPIARILYLRNAGLRIQSAPGVVLRDPSPSLQNTAPPQPSPSSSIEHTSVENPSVEITEFDFELRLDEEEHIQTEISQDQSLGYENENEISAAFDAINESQGAAAQPDEQPLISGVTAAFDAISTEEPPSSATMFYSSSSPEPKKSGDLLSKPQPSLQPSEVTQSAGIPAIAHPDSDAPENETPSRSHNNDSLPPLDATQSFTPNTATPSKVTREYAPNASSELLSPPLKTPQNEKNG